MAPAEVHVLIRDLVAAGTDADLVGRVAAALVTAETSHASRGVTVAAAPRKRSAGAIRTARWRARRRLGLVTGVTSHVTPAIRRNDVLAAAELPDLRAIEGTRQDFGGVTSETLVASQASHGDGGGKKENPPHPLKKNTTPKAPLARRRRHRVTAETPPVLVDRSKPDRRGRLWVDAADPVYLDLQAHSPTRSLPGSGDGWWFAPAKISEARERLGRTVTALPVRAVTTGPPERTMAKA